MQLNFWSAIAERFVYKDKEIFEPGFLAEKYDVMGFLGL